MSVLPLPVRGTAKLFSRKPNLLVRPRSVDVAYTVASTHKPPETLRRLIIHDGSEKRTNIEFPQLCGQTATETAAIASITRRLGRVAESIIESEKQKFNGKFRGKMLSEEEMLVVERMSKEIVGKLMEEPIKYLTSGRCCHTEFDDRLNDLESLTKILEGTCFWENRELRGIYSSSFNPDNII